MAISAPIDTKPENAIGSAVNRRDFILSGAVLLLTSSIKNGSALTSSAQKKGESLIPRTPGEVPNYWCTWAVQNYMYGHHLRELQPEILEGDSGSRLAHQAMNEQLLLGNEGWAHRFYSQVRSDLYLLLDDGWESGGTATFQLDTTKFPSFSGSPVQRLTGLNKSIQAADWRGAALWCRNTPGGEEDKHLEILSQQAGIHYWKIDIGDPAFHLIDVRKANHLSVRFEHVHGEGPVNGNWRGEGRFGAQEWGSRRQQILAHTDVYRTYDVTSILSLPTTLDRVVEMLKGAHGHPEVHALLNVEDEVYVAAVLGCTMGILRHPLEGLRPGADTDLFFNGPRQTKRRMDEVVRALRWQRIAPPFAVGGGDVEASDEILTDGWAFVRGQTWDSELVGQTAYQAAPACIARNISLPHITAPGEKPFVFAARFPNGAVAIGVQERTRPGRAWYMPPADVELHVGKDTGPIGIFGGCRTLTLSFDKSLAGKRILVQDLASEELLDVTDHFHPQGHSLQLTEADLRSFGLYGASEGDLSSPGLVLAIR